MSDILKVAALQLDITSGDKTRNISEASRLIESLPEGYDIAVLPEMFTTGFICDPSQSALLAESVDGVTMTAMRSLSARHKIAICGSFIARDGDAVYNRAFLSNRRATHIFMTSITSFHSAGKISPIDAAHLKCRCSASGDGISLWLYASTSAFRLGSAIMMEPMTC